MSKFIKKAFTVSVVLTTIIWSIGLFAMPLSVVAAESGDVVKKAGLSAVFYLGADGKLYTFPADREFFTWYDNFDSVMTLSDAEIDSYPIGGNVTAKPGVKLVQTVTNDVPWVVFSSAVYAVDAGGNLRKIGSAEIAEALYGANWESMIIPVVVSNVGNYGTGDNIGAASAFDVDAVKAAATSINDDKNLSMSGSGTSLTCSLAADTPASGLALAGAARFPFTYVDCTASSDGDITIDSMVIERTGAVAQDGAFASIAVIDRTTNQQIGLNKSLNATHQSTLNDDVTVTAGSTKRLALTGNMTTLALMASYAGEVPSLTLASMTLKAGASLIGTLPITGNYQNLNATVTIAAGTLGTGPSNPSTDSAPEIGKENVNFTEVKITNSSSSSTNPSGLKVKQIKWTQNGSAGDSDVENIDLVDQNGAVLQTSAMDNKEVFHSFAEGSEPTITSGQNRSYMARGDAAGGTTRTIDLHIKNFTDILVWDADHSVYVTLTAGSGANAASPVINGTAHTIGQGTLKVAPSATGTINIGEGSTQETLGSFKLTAKGEPIEITAIGWIVKLTQATAGSGSSTTDITNLTIYDPDGNVVAGPQDLGTTETVESTTVYHASATTTDTITVPVGENIYTVKGDVNTDIDLNDTIQVQVVPAQITATGEVSGDSVTATPATVQSSVINTVKAGTLTVSITPDPIVQTIVAGTLGHTFVNIVLDASASSEDIRVSQIGVRVDSTTGFTNLLSNIELYNGDDLLEITSDATSGLAGNANPATSTHTLSETLVVTKGTQVTLTGKANVDSSAAADDIFQMGIADGAVSATGASTGNTVTPTYIQSHGTAQTIVAVGTLELVKAAANPKSGLLPRNTDGITVGVMTADAMYEDINIESIYVTAAAVNSGGWDQIDSLYLYDGSTLVKQRTPSATDGTNVTQLLEMTSNPLVVPHSVSTDYTFKVDTSNVDAKNGSKGSSGQGFQLKINAVGDVNAKGAESGTDVTLGQVPTFNSYYVYKSVPTITPEDEQTTGIAGSMPSGQAVTDLYKLTVRADSAGDIALYKLSFLFATSVSTVSSPYLYDGTETVAATTTWDLYPNSGASDLSGQGIASFLFTDDGTAPDSNRDDVVPYRVAAGTETTFTLRATVDCSSSNDDNKSCSAGDGSISVSLLGDGAAADVIPNSAAMLQLDDATAGLEASTGEADFIWGDLTVTQNLSSTTASRTLQWTNGYLLPKKNGGKLQATSSAAITS
ncbi:hypothetical protein KKA15_01195 [Patescibacteria group bacterium]|nr:hypothetical protein [Patescibacteria group bacterium]